jgi:hypothetical protein
MTTARAALLWASALAPALVIALGGCTALDAHSSGRLAAWHAAQVVSVGRAADLAGLVEQDCGADDGPSAPYAVVRYRAGGVHSRSLGTGRLPEGTELHAGDTVYVNVLDCGAPLMTPAQRAVSPAR